MKNDDTTSPTVGGPLEKTSNNLKPDIHTTAVKEDSTSLVGKLPDEATNTPKADIHTTAGNELLLSLLMKDVEELKDLIQDDRKKRSQRWTSNPVALALLGFLLTGLLGNSVTAYLTYKQHQRAAERSFIDESNKQRIQKIGEVWEQLDQDEHTIDQLLSADEDIVAKFPTPSDRAKEIRRIVQKDRAKISEYRFWLGQNIFDRINDYLNTNITYSIGKLSGTPEADLTATRNARDAAKSSVDQVREELLHGVPK